MSNDILGAVATVGGCDIFEAHLAAVSKRTPLGLFTVEKSTLRRTIGKFVTDLSAPSVTAIRVTDGPAKHNASYLIDGLDYAPESKLGLPVRSTDRLQLLMALANAIFELRDVVRLDLALMDSSQLDQLREIGLDDFPAVLIADTQHFSPPDTLYRITRSSPVETPSP
ncbi:hypothetical protein WME79_34305 [Sorangium sp. So ce726]|uniref:hypothetical protein n=1 Tax=Sorangium sp. So ce726 TaxID=3133319 RepID=UPI003F63B0F1